MLDRAVWGRWSRGAAMLVLGVGLGGAVASCGAEGTPAPDLDPADQPRPSACKPIREVMPHFFELIERRNSPIKGLRDAVSRLADGEDTGVNPLGGMLGSAVRGIANFANDPPESGEAECLSTPPEAPLCNVEAWAPDACESRLCALRRALDFGIRNQEASAALKALQPVLGTVIGYLSNHGPGADGQEHYAVVEVLHRTSAAEYEGVCAPRNLTVVIDGLLTYFRPDASCGDRCAGTKLLSSLKAVLNDPALATFLNTYESAEQDGSGRGAFQKLGRVLLLNLATTPEDEHYFDSIQTLLDQVGGFLGRDPAKYGVLKATLDDLAALLKDLLNPQRPGALLKELKVVVGCLNAVDPDAEVVGALYDLLSRRGGVDKGGLDLKDLVGSIDELVQQDRKGLLFGMLHAILASLAEEEQALEYVRASINDLLTLDNARDALPAMQEMLSAGVLDELIALLDNLLYGCKATP